MVLDFLLAELDMINDKLSRSQISCHFHFFHGLISGALISLGKSGISQNNV